MEEYTRTERDWTVASAGKRLKLVYLCGLAALLLLWIGAGKRVVSIDYFIIAVVVVTIVVGIFLYRAVLLCYGAAGARRAIVIYIVMAPLLHLGVIIYPLIIMHDIRIKRLSMDDERGKPSAD